ncbi:FAD-dependent oxidoreductase [Actinoplanes sp. NPDC051475]|uniref:FAD-dependent oxidoreductase n=1 Tax=Actinoplanes sp. NPDC051475 TaxID=3157225 RepID=UPI00344DDDAF
MTKVVVLGAGLAGLTTASLLERDGHDVTVVERDPDGPPSRPCDAWIRWRRPGVGQFQSPHLMLPRWWALLRQELPDLAAELKASGARHLNLVEALPSAWRGGMRPEDDRFDTVTARRPVIEAVLAGRVNVRRGTKVAGLVTSGTRVSGIAVAGGSIPADLVVDCSGRHSPLSAWLAKAGLPPVDFDRADHGFVYYGRHFRGPRLPEALGYYRQDYDSFTVLTLPADNDTWSVAIVASSQDREARRLRRPESWQAAIAQFPLAAHWAEAESISDIDVMAGTHNRRRLGPTDGGHLTQGVVSVGDSWASTNPSLGRGASMAFLHALHLRDVLRATETPDEISRHFDELTTQHMTPLYDSVIGADQVRLDEVDADIAGRPFETPDPGWARGRAFLAASLRDPDIARAYLAVSSFIATTRQALATPRVRESIATTPPTRYPLPGPTRAQIFDKVAP